ncbi:endoplasmic reticulum-Golgi intermediate compartment protein 3 [Artemisia annua]|uniref:Endoplasmic reticulum-Golgi intermediate compartment protein 3 n=1 Tax=Artemisia annua TaxID=35608 RepID=A0A2U1PDC1_ARTAN|nr:endoplasmic reticulum-Golgi intermediate compartment protein 3 [Artemisia annua]
MRNLEGFVSEFESKVDKEMASAKGGITAGSVFDTSIDGLTIVTFEVWVKALEKDAPAVVVLRTIRRMGVWLVQGWSNEDLYSVQAIVASKKGVYILKYGPRGKRKLCPFRLLAAFPPLYLSICKKKENDGVTAGDIWAYERRQKRTVQHRIFTSDFQYTMRTVDRMPKKEDVKIQAWENHEKRKAGLEMKRTECLGIVVVFRNYFGRTFSTYTCKREGFLQSINDEACQGCKIYGFLDVDKLAANFRFAQEKSFQESSEATDFRFG